MRPNYLDAVEGLGDILVFAISRNVQPETVDRCLEELKKPVTRILEAPNVVLADELDGANDEQIGYALYFSPEEALRNFATPIKQVSRGLVSSASSRNDDASLECSHWLRTVIRDVLDNREASTFARVWLRVVGETVESVRLLSHPWLASSLTHGWYISLLFQSPHFRDNPFPLDTLIGLSEWVFRQVQRHIDDVNEQAFRDFYGSLVDQVFEIPPGDAEAYELNEYFYSLDIPHSDKNELVERLGINHLVNLIGYSEAIADEDNYRRAREAMQQTYEQVVGLFGIEVAAPFKAKCSGLVLRLNHRVRMAVLEEMTFSLAAYAMHLHKYERVNAMLQYKQPPGATWTSLNRAPLPENVAGLVREFVVRWSYFRNFDHFGSHLDGAGRKMWAGVILLARLCLQTSIDPATVTAIDWHPKELFFEPNRANNAKETCERLVAMLEASELSEEEAAFISPKDAAEASAGIELAIAVLKRTQQQAEDALVEAESSHPISQERLRQHREGILKYLAESSDLRGKLLRAHPELYVENYEVPAQGQRQGVHLTTNRSAFLDAWWEHSWAGKTEAECLGQQEVAFFTLQLAEMSQAHEWEELLAFLSELEPTRRWICVSSLKSLTMALHNCENFKWEHVDSPESGAFVVDEMSVPLYQLRQWEGEEGLVVVDLETFGSFVQESPLDTADDPASVEGFLYVSVTEIEGEPTKVLSKVYERLVYRPTKKFKGDFFKFPSEEVE